MFVDATSSSTGSGVTGVTGAIRQAAKVTGASFQYLLAAAKIESNLDPSANARTSSAGGLFQFIDQTWLGTIKQSGSALGYGRYADAIQQTGSGRYVVSDPSLRTEIMKLRRDPAANAVMAGAFTKSNAAYLSQKLGREPTEGELYIAHFLGARGAAKLIGLAAATPHAIAASSFSRAASSNRPIFYGDQGRPRSFAEVTRALMGRYELARATQAAPDATQTAATKADSARVAQAYAAASPAPAISAPAADGDLLYRNPYRSGQRRPVVLPEPPVAQAAPQVSVVSPDAIAQIAAVAPTRPSALSGEPLGLFQDMAPNVRALFTGS